MWRPRTIQTVRRIAVIVVTLGLVVACSPEPIELRGIDLPPASLPDDFDGDVWAISFSRQFEPGSWEEGRHRYSLQLDCAVLFDEPLQAPDQSFSVTPLTRSFENVYLRLNGLGPSLLGPTGLFSLRPDQPTTATITVIGVSREKADSATSCAGEVTVDGQDVEALVAGEPFRP